MKITNAMRECVSNVLEGRCSYGVETLGRCISAGLLVYNGGGDTTDHTSYGVTAEGAREAEAWREKRGKAREAARTAGRARAAAAASVGLVRTRYGWE